MIYEQLREYCGCVDEVNEADVDELINIVSLATGWLREPCETFLTGERREVIDLPSCADCPIEFKPYYHPFDPDSFRFYLVETKGINETVQEIKTFAYSPVSKVFRVDPGLKKCNCGGCDCGCETTYKLMAEYVAGYDDIPDCLLPVFCNLLTVIQAKNTCDCNDCGCESDRVAVDRYGNVIDNVKYFSGDVVSVSLENDLGKMLVEQYKNQLATLSLLKVSHNIWGIVV